MANAREVSDRYTAAIKAKDAGAIGALFAETGSLEEPAGSFEGREAIVEYWERFFTAFPDLDVRDEVKADAVDVAVNEWSASGTNTGALQTPEGTLSATGNRMTMRGCDVIAVRGGLIQSHRVYYDQLAFLTQLGLVPEGAVAS
jgi:ketosteroid isomerase-like protein